MNEIVTRIGRAARIVPDMDALSGELRELLTMLIEETRRTNALLEDVLIQERNQTYTAILAARMTYDTSPTEDAHA